MTTNPKRVKRETDFDLLNNRAGRIAEILRNAAANDPEMARVVREIHFEQLSSPVAGGRILRLSCELDQISHFDFVFDARGKFEKTIIHVEIPAKLGSPAQKVRKNVAQLDRFLDILAADAEAGRLPECGEQIGQEGVALLLKIIKS